MANYNWDWSKLPEYEHDAAIKAIEEVDNDTLWRLNHVYGMSPEPYCCPCHIIYTFFKAKFD